MANYTIQLPWGVPYKSKLPSAKIEVIDVYLSKVPNFVDGSTHTAAAQVILGGAGMWVTGAFQADSADITITNGKALDVLSGGQISTASGSTYSGMSRAIAADVAGATSDGLHTTTLPAARAAASGASSRWTG